MKKIVILILLINAISIFAEDFAQIKKQFATDAQASDKLGYSVDIFGDWAVVGAHLEDGSGTDRGAVYIFYRNQGGTDNWGQVKKIIASDAADNDYFGISVSIDSNIIVVGAFTEDGAGSNRGATYIFYKDQGGQDNWGEIKKIVASDPNDQDEFGISVSVDNNIVVVGAFHDDEMASDAGAAYIYYKDQGGSDNWGELKKIKASDAATDDIFGYSVSISGDLIVVGAYQEDATGLDNGSAYIFSKNEGGSDNWGQIKKLTASDGQNSDHLGVSVCISGNTVVAGADYEDGTGTDIGAAYIYSKDEGGSNNWGQVKKITASDGETGDNFGNSVYINADKIIIGTFGEDGAGGTARGAAYVYEQNYGGTNNWGQIDKLTASDANDMDFFGKSVAYFDGYIVVGANQDNEAASEAGAVYFFKSYTISTTQVFPTRFIGGTNMTISYAVSSEFNSGNTFTAQLSNSSGNFSSPTTIGTATATSSGTISVTIPYNASTGTGYRIRVIGSNPSVTGDDCGNNLSVVSAWTQKANIGTARHYAASCALNNKGYIFGGWVSGANTNEVWEFNPLGGTNGTYTSKTNLSFTRSAISAFTINDSIFVGGGHVIGTYTTYSDFYYYNPTTGLISKTNQPWGGAWKSNLVIDNIAYNAMGWLASGPTYPTQQYDINKMNIYNSTTNSWSSDITVPLNVSRGGITFALDGKAYFGLGYSYGTIYNAMCYYNPSTSSFSTSVASYPGTGAFGNYCFTLNDRAYLGGGENGSSTRYNEFYEYNNTTNSWKRKPDIPGGNGRANGVSFTVNNRGYVGLGQDNSNNQLSDMWEFRDPSNSTPTLTTNSVSGIGISTTTSGGEIQNDGGYSITAKGVCWNTTGSPTISDDYSEDGTGYASFTSDITNLQPNTTYYVRAYATNEIGTSYGSEVSFRTEEIANTIKYSSIAKNSSGVVQSNTYISVKVSIMNSGRTTVYSESQTVYTDTYGNYSINIGKGDILNGDFSSIDVASEDYTLEIETDVSAPFSDYILVEKRKLISLLAQTASSSPATFKSGDIVPFIDLADRPGWTYTGKSECLGSIDTWTAISNSNTPSGRRHCPAVWTGKQILIWGGVNQTEVLTDGKIYDYATDTWINISSINEPSARAYHTAIWTGSEMLLWGGSDFSNNTFNSGARYNPTTDTWFEISTTNAPSARSNHTMIWTGSKVIVWGGINGTTFLNDGGLYDPTTNTWETISSINAPIARYGHSAVWTGSNMIIWGGFINNIVEATNTGAEYNPIDDTWITISTTNAPTARSVPAAVWTGKEMIIWGGHNNTSIEQNTGGKYYPESDTWISTSTTNAPSARVYSTCNWTGKEMIIWGGRDVSNNIINTGGMYNPNQDSWSSITTTNAPTARISFWISPGVWTGQEFIIWGGYNTSSIHYTDGSKLGTVLSIYWYKKD